MFVQKCNTKWFKHPSAINVEAEIDTVRIIHDIDVAYTNDDSTSFAILTITIIECII